MNAHVDERKILQLISLDYAIHRDSRHNFFVRYEPAGVASGMLVPLPSHELIGELQERFNTLENRPVSLLAIKDTIALLKGRVKKSAPVSSLRPVPAIASVYSNYGSQSLVMRTPEGKAMWLSRIKWDIVDPSVIETKRNAVFIHQNRASSSRLAEIAEKHHANPAAPVSASIRGNTAAIGNAATPAHTNPLEQLWKLFEQHFPALGLQQSRVVTAWLLGVLFKAPMPMLLLSGPRGCGKTYLAEVLAKLFSCSDRFNLDLPRLPVDIHKRLSDEIVVIFDNVRTIPATVSDELCRIMTGGYMAARGPQFAAYGHLKCSRIIMTSIHNPIEFEDLASRALVVELTPPNKGSGPKSTGVTKTEDELLADIGINLLDTLASALRQAPLNSAAQPLQALTSNAYLDYRFQKFLDHVMQVERALTGLTTMAEAIVNTLRDTDETAADDEPLIILLDELLDKPPHRYTGTAKDLIIELRTLKTATLWRSQPWLSHPRSLSVALKNLRHTLAARGIAYNKTALREHDLVKTAALKSLAHATTLQSSVSQTPPAPISQTTESAEAA